MDSSEARDLKSEASLTLLGNYVLLKRVAVGGMAEVFVGAPVDASRSPKRFAIKRILPSVADDPDFIRMFIDEARLVRNLDHPNICPLHELGQAGATYYIAMEFVWGKDVLAIINRFRKLRSRMPPEMLAWIGVQVCQGLEYAHRKRNRQGELLHIVHRDISPQNILVGYDGDVKVIDFGIAKAASRNAKTRAGVLKGKFGYMSPEQVQGSEVDHRSDLFSLGTCLYEMATCERLFRGESEFETLEKVRAANVAPLADGLAGFPPALDAVIRKALHPDVSHRWQSAKEFKEALRQSVLPSDAPFETAAMSTWMRQAFSPEIEKEQSWLGRAEDAVPRFLESAANNDLQRDLPHEVTYIVDASGARSSADDVVAQPTRIFFSSEDSSSSHARMVAPALEAVHAEPTLVHSQLAPFTPSCMGANGVHAPNTEHAERPAVGLMSPVAEVSGSSTNSKLPSAVGDGGAGVWRRGALRAWKYLAQSLLLAGFLLFLWLLWR